MDFHLDQLAKLPFVPAVWRDPAEHRDKIPSNFHPHTSGLSGVTITVKLLFIILFIHEDIYCQVGFHFSILLCTLYSMPTNKLICNGMIYSFVVSKP